MKKVILLLTAASILSVVGCKKTIELMPDPVINLPGITDNKLAFTSEGGSQTIEYTVSNPVEGAKMTAEADQDWITNINSETDGVVSFDVQANTNAESRTAVIRLVYEYGDASVSAEVSATQEGYDASFSFEVPAEDVTATSIRVLSSCLDPSLRWYADLAVTDEIGETFAEDYRTSFLELVAFYEVLGLTLDDMLYTADYKDDYTYSGLNQLTSYTPIAFGMDLEGNYTTSMEFGEAVSTTEMQLVDLDFDIKTNPGTNFVTLDITPSDPDAFYFATVIDDSFYEAGYSDEEIMTEICENYGSYLETYALQGNVTEYKVTGMSPETHYYAVAFGVDLSGYTYNSEMTKVEFSTIASQPTDAFAEGSIDNYWDSEDIVAYNPDYANYVGEKPLFAAFDITYNETAAGAYAILWNGDVAAEYPESEIYSSTLSQGDYFVKGSPANIFYMNYNETVTACVIAVDESGNYGDMSMKVITLTEDGVSSDYALFDEYFNSLMGASSVSAKTFSTTINVPERPAMEFSKASESVKAFKGVTLK